jgi:hypothetical protein
MRAVRAILEERGAAFACRVLKDRASFLTSFFYIRHGLVGSRLRRESARVQPLPSLASPDLPIVRSPTGVEDVRALAVGPARLWPGGRRVRGSPRSFRGPGCALAVMSERVADGGILGISCRAEQGRFGVPRCQVGHQQLDFQTRLRFFFSVQCRTFHTIPFRWLTLVVFSACQA